MSVALGADAVVGPVGQDRHGGSLVVVAEVDVATKPAFGERLLTTYQGD